MRAALSVQKLMSKSRDFDESAERLNLYSNNLSDYLVAESLPYVKKEVPFGRESITLEIYTKAVRRLMLQF